PAPAMRTTKPAGPKGPAGFFSGGSDLVKRTLVLSCVSVVAAVACRSSRVRPAEQNVDDTSATLAVRASGDLRPATVDVGGTWVGGSGPEPTVAMLTSEPECRYHPAS